MSTVECIPSVTVVSPCPLVRSNGKRHAIRVRSFPFAFSDGGGRGEPKPNEKTHDVLLRKRAAAYRLSRLGILHRRIKGAVFDRVPAFLHRFGSLSLLLAALFPPPFPTSAFVIGAGVTRYPFIAFVLSFGTGRVCRFALLAYFASVLGRRFMTSMWSATHWCWERLLAVCWCASECWGGSSSINPNRMRLPLSSIYDKATALNVECIFFGGEIDTDLSVSDEAVFEVTCDRPTNRS